VLDGGINIGFLSSGGEKVGNYFLPAECSEGQRPDKFLRRASHHHLHTNTTVLQETYQFSRLISGDSTGDAESDLHRKIVAFL